MYIYIYIYKQLVLHHSFMLVNIYRYQKSLVSRIQDDVMLIRKFNHFCGSLMVAPGTLGIDLKTFRELKKKNGKKQMKKILLSTNTFLFERPKESCCYGKKQHPRFPMNSHLSMSLHQQHIPLSASGGGALFCFSSNSRRNLLVDQAIYCHPPI